MGIHAHFYLGGYLGAKSLGLIVHVHFNLLEVVSFPEGLHHCIMLHFYQPWERVPVSSKP